MIRTLLLSVILLLCACTATESACNFKAEKAEGLDFRCSESNLNLATPQG